MAEFSGKVAIVTGASSGIGRSCAQLYARDGAKVVVSDVDDKGGQETVKIIQAAGGEAAFFKTDVSKPDGCQALVQQTIQTFGRLDFACNNAGISGEQRLIADYSIDGWQKVIAIDLNGVFYCMKFEIPEILKTGGAIVNMTSILGMVGSSNSSAYVAAKHGVIGLTKSAAIEYSAQGIRINAVGPGAIRTPMVTELEKNKDTKDIVDHLVSLHPVGRFGKPEEVAEMVVWLSSNRASFVTGAYYPVDGGYLSQ